MFCRVVLLLTCMGASPCWAQFAPDATTSKQANSAVYQKIDELRRAMAGLRIDGRDHDWKAVPQFGDLRDDAGADRHRDIVAAAIAPTKDYLALMLRTAAKPSTERWAFYFEVDMFGTTDNDFRIEVESPERVNIRLFGPDMQPGEPRKMLDAKVAIRDVVELRIPYQEALNEPSAALGLVFHFLVTARTNELTVRNHVRPWIGLAYACQLITCGVRVSDPCPGACNIFCGRQSE